MLALAGTCSLFGGCLWLSFSEFRLGFRFYCLCLGWFVSCFCCIGFLRFCLLDCVIFGCGLVLLTRFWTVGLFLARCFGVAP